MTEPPQTNPAPRWELAGWLLVAAAFLVGFYNFPLRVVGRGFDHLPGDVIDNRLNLVVLEHGYRYLTGKADQFWDIPIYYPVRGVTAWSDAHIGTLPLYSALRAAGLSPERAFQGYFLVPFLLNYVAAVWAARRLGLGPVGSAVTGYVFAYGLPLASQIGHAQLFARFLVPPAVVFAWEWLRAPRSAWRLAATAACMVCQTYISVYIGYFLGLLVGVGLMVSLVVAHWRLPWRDLVWPGWRVWVARAVIVIGASAVLFPLVDAHRRNGSELPKEHVRLFAPRPLAWITPPGMAATFPELGAYTKLGSTMPGAGEEQLLPGVLPLFGVALGLPVALFVFARPRWFGSAASAMAVGAVSSLALALLVTKFGENGETWYYESLLRLPGATGIRAISRVVLVLLFPAGFALGATLDLVACGVGRWSRGAAAVVAVAALAAVAADQWLTSVTGERKNDWWWARNPVAASVERRERIAAAIHRHPGPTLVFAFQSVADRQGPGGWPALQIDVMRASQDAGVPTINGWSGRSPPNWSGNPPPDWGPPASYRALMKWLTVTNGVPPEVLAGLLIIGEPVPDPDPAYDAAMRAKYPPVPLK